MNNDAIHIKGLTFFAYHGVFSQERDLGQKFIVSLILYTDLSAVGKNDDLSTGICYKDVIESTLEFCTKNTFYTIEALASGLARSLLCTFTKISSVDITLEKPNASINAVFENICVHIHRKPSDFIPEHHNKTVQTEKKIEYA